MLWREGAFAEIAVVLCDDLDDYDDGLEKRIHQDGLPCPLIRVSLSSDVPSTHIHGSTYLKPLQTAARLDFSTTASHLQIVEELLSVPAIWYHPFQHEVEQRSYRECFIDFGNRFDVHVAKGNESNISRSQT